jgi:hypothetical protein
MVIQLSLLTAFQVHPLEVTPTVPVPPATPKLCDDVVIE